MSEATLKTISVTHALDAHVAAIAFDRAMTCAAYALGDGTLRLARLDRPEQWVSVPAHDGAAMALAAAPDEGFVSGGDDGRLVHVTSDGAVRELASFGGKWVDQVASTGDRKSGAIACAAGRTLHVFSAEGHRLRSMEHPSTVTGIAFDARGKRVVASHYNGASLWFVGSTSQTPRRLEWKGSHIGVAIHPAAEAVVTAMQENALHGWRLPDGHDMRMSGYPAKPESIGFTRTGRYLASSGADAVVLWPFFGGGPMGKPPVEMAQREVVCTRVACHPRVDVVAAGYADGAVEIAVIADNRVGHAVPPGHGAVTALAWANGGEWLAFGTEQGFTGLFQAPPP